MVLEMAMAIYLARMSSFRAVLFFPNANPVPNPELGFMLIARLDSAAKGWPIPTVLEPSFVV